MRVRYLHPFAKQSRFFFPVLLHVSVNKASLKKPDMEILRAPACRSETGSVRGFGYTVFRGLINWVYDIFISFFFPFFQN